jgi:molybdopterin biosynthesis enzyme MoaB
VPAGFSVFELISSAFIIGFAYLARGVAGFANSKLTILLHACRSLIVCDGDLGVGFRPFMGA